MDDKTYYKEHSELINLLRTTANKLEHEADKQAAEVKKMKGGVGTPRGSIASTAAAQSTAQVQALLNAAIARLQAIQPPQQGSGNEKATKLEKALHMKRIAEKAVNKLPAQMIEAAAHGDVVPLAHMQRDFRLANKDREYHARIVKKELDKGKGKGKKKCMLGIKGGCGLCGGC